MDGIKYYFWRGRASLAPVETHGSDSLEARFDGAHRGLECVIFIRQCALPAMTPPPHASTVAAHEDFFVGAPHVQGCSSDSAHVRSSSLAPQSTKREKGNEDGKGRSQGRRRSDELQENFVYVGAFGSPRESSPCADQYISARLLSFPRKTVSSSLQLLPSHTPVAGRFSIGNPPTIPVFDSLGNPPPQSLSVQIPNSSLIYFRRNSVPNLHRNLSSHEVKPDLQEHGFDLSAHEVKPDLQEHGFDLKCVENEVFCVVGIEMKPVPRNRTDEEAGEKLTGSTNKDGSFTLLKIVSGLVIFVTGMVIGLSTTSHVTRYFTSHTELFFSSKQNAICLNEDCLTMRNFIHPRSLTHEMKDEQLFWRASMVPIKVEYPYRRVPKVAFMFLTRGPLPLVPLWDRFFRGHEEFYNIYVHALPGYKLDVPQDSAFFGRQIPSQDVKWGSIELADAERRLLANALLDFSNERFVLLSESCIPVYDFTTVYKYITGSVHSFVDTYDDPGRYGRGRYSRQMLPDIKLMHWRKGSQWFELNRALAVNIVADTKYYTLFRKYCKPSCYPDEHYFPTLINMFFGAMNANRSLTWVDWSRGGPHPATFGAADITESFVRALRYNGTDCMYNSGKTSICYLFARKFAPSALGPLLNLTSTVMNF
ncbi:hypothetical protein ACLOJK_016924 [Asimina triloba]